MRSWLVAAAAAALLLGCAPAKPRIAAVHMPGSQIGGGSGSGSMTLVFSREVENAVVAIDGVLVADKVRTRRLRVAGVPSGRVQVAVAADGLDRQLDVQIQPGRDVAVPVGAAPEPEPDSPVAAAAMSIGGYLLSRGVSAWLF